MPDPAAERPLAGAIPPADADERALIAALLRHDRKAAAQFVAAHIDAVYSYARHRLTPRADLADDVVQEVFVAAFNGLAAFQGQSSLRTWLIGIARHKVEDVYRQRLRNLEKFDDLDTAEGIAVATSGVEDELDRSRLRARTERVLVQLPERYGLILLWRYWEQRSTREIATAVGTTEKSVERTLARARARFREAWMKESK